MKQAFKIEVYRNGEWVHQDSTDDIMDAYMLASSLCSQTPEDYIRISGPIPSRWRVNAWKAVILILNMAALALLVWGMHH